MLSSHTEHSIKGKSSLKSKRVRTIFTPEQLERLEAEFERQQYMVGPERLYLAHTLQLTEAQVSVNCVYCVYTKVVGFWRLSSELHAGTWIMMPNDSTNLMMIELFKFTFVVAAV